MNIEMGKAAYDIGEAILAEGEAREETSADEEP